MTDKEIMEIIEIIATKVMGWHKGEATFMRSQFRFYEVTEEAWLDESGNMKASMDFNPLESDNYCMMAWDKFVKGKIASMSTMGEGGWMGMCMDKTTGQNTIVENKDRRRAMCECMVKAVE